MKVKNQITQPNEWIVSDASQANESAQTAKNTQLRTSSGVASGRDSFESAKQNNLDWLLSSRSPSTTLDKQMGIGFGDRFDLRTTINYWESMRTFRMAEGFNGDVERIEEIIKALEVLNDDWNDLPPSRRIVMDALGHTLFDGTGSGENPASGPRSDSNEGRPRSMRPGGRREEPQTDGFSVQGSVQGGAAGSRARQPGGVGGSQQTGSTNRGGGSVRSQESDHSRGSSGDNVQSGSTREAGESTHPRNEKAGPQRTGGSDAGDSGGYENDYTDPNTGIQVVSPEGQAPGETPGLPPDDLMTRGGSDDVRGRLAKQLPRGVTQQDIDLVGTAVVTKTGPDDKERPDLGSGASSEGSHYGGDLGDDLPYSLSSGGSIDRNIGEELLRKLRPINPGGPDPEK